MRARFIFISYSCANFSCKHHPEAVIHVRKVDVEKVDEEKPIKCKLCGANLVSEDDQNLDDTLFELGIV